VAETPTVNDSGIFAVRVYDSADRPHFDDTRSNEESGVGSGFINFQVDDAGRPTAFQFDTVPRCMTLIDINEVARAIEKYFIGGVAQYLDATQWAQVTPHLGARTSR
jgi:hypothetical protein